MKTIFLLFLTLQSHAQNFTEASQSVGIEVLHEGKQYLGVSTGTLR